MIVLFGLLAWWRNRRIKSHTETIIRDLNEDLRDFDRKVENQLNIFKRIVTKINKINSKIDSRIVVARSQITDLNDLVVNLESSRAANEKVKTRFEEMVM